MSLPRALTDHAIERYRKRHDPRASVREIQAVLDAGRFQVQMPGALDPSRGEPVYGYVVNGRVVFPMAHHGRELAAVTCLAIRRRPKADRRAHRELEREERWYA